MMVGVEKAGRAFHVLKHHIIEADSWPGVLPCGGHSMALLTEPGTATTFEIDQDSGIFVTVEWRAPVTST